MGNLFSIFDPNSIFSLPLNWVGLSTGILIFPSFFWLTKNQVFFTVIGVANFVKGEFSAILGKTPSGGTWPTISLFFFILIINFSGLLPYVFPTSRHLVVSVSLALPLWLGHTGYSWVVQPNHMLAHLVPLGTPGALMPFMVLIERVRAIIRPLTLSVRLAANIIAGHLLLTLLSSQGPHLSLSLTFFLLGFLFVLNMLETAVAIIQAYVFRVLSTLYLREVNTQGINR